MASYQTLGLVVTLALSACAGSNDEDAGAASGGGPVVLVVVPSASGVAGSSAGGSSVVVVATPVEPVAPVEVVVPTVPVEAVPIVEPVVPVEVVTPVPVPVEPVVVPAGSCSDCSVAYNTCSGVQTLAVSQVKTDCDVAASSCRTECIAAKQVCGQACVDVYHGVDTQRMNNCIAECEVNACIRKPCSVAPLAVCSASLSAMQTDLIKAECLPAFDACRDACA